MKILLQLTTIGSLFVARSCHKLCKAHLMWNQSSVHETCFKGRLNVHFSVYLTRVSQQLKFKNGLVCSVIFVDISKLVLLTRWWFSLQSSVFRQNHFLFITIDVQVLHQFQLKPIRCNSIQFFLSTNIIIITVYCKHISRI